MLFWIEYCFIDTPKIIAMVNSGKLLLFSVLVCFSTPNFGQKFLPSNTEENVLYEIECMENTMYIIKEDSKLILTDKNHNRINDLVYDQIKMIKKEMLYAKVNSELSLINCEGKVVTAGKYKEVAVFYNQNLDHRYFVSNNYGKVGLIDGEGNELIPPIYDSLDPMSQHKYLFARIGSEKYFFDYDGREIQYFKLDEYIKKKRNSNQ